MPHEITPPPPTTIDPARLLTVVETYLTPADWRRAVAAGRAPSYVRLRDDQILARRAGSEPACRRWHALTPAQALADAWPFRQGMMVGEACEDAAAWLLEREAPVRTYIATSAAPPPTQMAHVVGNTVILPTEVIIADDFTMSLSVDGKPVRYVMSENAPTRAPVMSLTEAAVWLWLGGVALFALALIGVCSL